MNAWRALEILKHYKNLGDNLYSSVPPLPILRGFVPLVIYAHADNQDIGRLKIGISNATVIIDQFKFLCVYFFNAKRNKHVLEHTLVLDTTNIMQHTFAKRLLFMPWPVNRSNHAKERQAIPHVVG
jgi:hypothetical protein